MGSHLSHIDELLFPELNVENEKFPQLGKRLGPYYAQDDPTPVYIEIGQRVKMPKQAQFLWAIDNYDEVGAGGAAGPGKSFVLMKSHIKKHLQWLKKGITGVNTGMFCKTLKDLERRHTDAIDTMIPNWMGTFNASKMVYKFRKKYGGGRIYFCNTEDPEKYRSVQFGYVTVDEATELDETTYLLIKSRLRWPGLTDLCIASATNPGGVGHKWYYKRFLDPKFKERPVYYAQYDRWTRGSYFIQALPEENPFLTVEYYINLESLPPDKRDALKYGKWDVFEGQFFDFNPRVHQIKRFRIPDEWPKIFAVDLGSAHPTAAGWIALQPPNDEFPKGRKILYRYYEEINKDVKFHKRKIANLCARDKNIVIGCGGHDMFSHRNWEEGQLTPAQRFNSDDEWGQSLNIVEAPRDRPQGWSNVHSAISYQGSSKVTPTGDIVYDIEEMPEFFVFSDLQDYWKSITSMIYDQGKSDDLKKTTGIYPVFAGDEAADVTRYLMWFANGEDLVTESPVKKDTSIYRYAKPSPAANPNPFSRF